MVDFTIHSTEKVYDRTKIHLKIEMVNRSLNRYRINSCNKSQVDPLKLRDMLKDIHMQRVRVSLKLI